VESPSSFIASLQKIKGGNYGQNLVSKSKYTIRGSLLGLVVGAAVEADGSAIVEALDPPLAGATDAVVDEVCFFL